MLEILRRLFILFINYMQFCVTLATRNTIISFSFCIWLSNLHV